MPREALERPKARGAFADAGFERWSRDVIFISRATLGDDEFVLWLAPRLEATGYKVFAEILSLEPLGSTRSRSLARRQF